MSDSFDVEVLPDEFTVTDDSDNWTIYTTTDIQITIELQAVGLNDAAIAVAARDAAIAAQLAAEAAAASQMQATMYDPLGVHADAFERANHHGTQLAATISNFNTAADARIAAAVGVSVQGYSAILAGTTASYTVALDTKLGGIAAGADVTVSALPVAIHGAASKATPVDADELALSDSAAAFGLKKLTWVNLKATLKTYLDTLYQPLAAAITSWSTVVRAVGFDTFVATPSSANLASLLTDETGTGANVFATNPVLVTPNLGTPSAVNLVNGTGLPVASGISGFAAGVATFLATPSSANLRAAITDETGAGAAVFANTPTLVTPIIGDATGSSVTISGSSQSSLKRSGVTGAAPASSGGVDANQFVVVGNNNVDWRFGLYSSGAVWAQLSLNGNYATNLPIILNPNGGNVGIGNTGSAPGSALTVAGAGAVTSGLNGSDVAFSLDFASNTFVIANGAVLKVQSAYSGLIITNEQVVNGNCCIWLVGGGVVSLVGGSQGVGEYTNTPTAGKISLSYDSSISQYKFTNQVGASRTLAIIPFRTRTAA